MCCLILFSNDGPLVFLMTLWVSGNLSERRSLDPTEGNRGKYARVSCFMCPRVAMLPYRTTRNSSRNAPAELESPAANESLFTVGLRGLWAERMRLLCYNFARTI